MPASPTSRASADASTSAAPRVRKDVARNRSLLLRTADELIAERGLDITFHELAAAAGVGVGTVYRHFASRDDLLVALIEDRIGTVHDILLAAEQITDPVRALRETIVRICEMQQADRAILQAMLSSAEVLRDLASADVLHNLARERLRPASERIVARAKATGRVRPDFAATDLPMIFMLSGALSQDVRPEVWRRYVDAILDGFMTSDADRAGATTVAPPEADVERMGKAAKTGR